MAIKSLRTKDTIIVAEIPYKKNGRNMVQRVYLTPFGKTSAGKTRYKSVTKHEAI